MTTYQGHLNDGSSIQKHSAGGNYPYVIGKRERAELPWIVIAPNGEETCFSTGEAAYQYAERAGAFYLSWVVRVGGNQWLSTQRGVDRLVPKIEQATRFTREDAEHAALRLTEAPTQVEQTSTRYETPNTEEPQAPAPAAAPTFEGCQVLTADDIQDAKKRAVEKYAHLWLHNYPRLLEEVILKKLSAK